MDEEEEIKCVKCNHDREHHRNNICYGDIGCTCFEFLTVEQIKRVEKITKPAILESRTIIPLPQPLTTHDNWRGSGWEYQKKWGKTQREMVEYLTFRCGLYEDEVRDFLRCNKASVRGRLSEIRHALVSSIPSD